MAGQKSYEELATELTITCIVKGLLGVGKVEEAWIRFFKMIQNTYEKTEEK